jgi:hypothetical protein
MSEGREDPLVHWLKHCSYVRGQENIDFWTWMFKYSEMTWSIVQNKESFKWKVLFSTILSTLEPN